MSTAVNSKATDGLIDFAYKGEIYQTYYKLFGDLSNCTHNPLIVLHGGPGLVHNYLVSFADLSAKYDIPVILYDQLGNGCSTHLRDKPHTFWTVDLFIDELVNLIDHFAIQNNFDLVGHSWGGVLAAELEIRRQPAGLKHLVLTNTPASSSLRNKSNMMLLQKFPKYVQEGLNAGIKDLEQSKAAVLEYYAVHGCIVKPLPEEYLYSIEQVFGKDGDTTVAAASIIRDWSIVDRLHLIRVPTFVINGRQDMCQDFVVWPFVEEIRQVKWVTFEKSSHTPFIEEREKYMQLIESFLNT
ncbi:hypothetical protein AX17_003672 [Amanita inopinata Kibby_2008]|nr:hypothetical protein AX17_003672 [Amanita inopinata Kibby_2008]